MVVNSTDRVRELFYSYAQATRNWRTADGMHSWPAGLIELGILLGEGLQKALSVPSNQPSSLAGVPVELFRLWMVSTRDLLDAVRNTRKLEWNENSTSSPGDQNRLESLFGELNPQMEQGRAGTQGRAKATPGSRKTDCVPSIALVAR